MSIMILRRFMMNCIPKQKNRRFTNLYDLIVSRENILLAYRNIKKNKGSKTKGVNATTILDIGKDNPERLISYVRNRMSNFQPMPVRRVEIPKDNGKVRPLGIPTMEDRHNYNNVLSRFLSRFVKPNFIN